jgi:TonB-dependent starch-binding outer membrane protein SusC
MQKAILFKCVLRPRDFFSWRLLSCVLLNLGLFTANTLFPNSVLATPLHITSNTHGENSMDFQMPTVSGRVTSKDEGVGLPGTNIIIKGTTQGTVTDSNGDFRIEVPSSESILIFSAIGFTSQEVVLNGRTTLNITMEPDITTLSEVVVVGYGTQKKADITGAVATFKTDQILERPLSRVDQALVGQMAGVRVKQTSGVPGRGFSVQVRGTGSITAGTEPLYVIDGFPLEPAQQNSSGAFVNGNPLDNINPNDIESIQVLKDASAAAIYGSRAANGVVIIKTKGGQVGKAKISLSAYTGINQTVKKLDVMNAEEWIDRATEIINYQWVHSGPGRTATQTTAERQAILDPNKPTFNPNFMLDDRWAQPGHPGLQYVDWQDLIFRTGITKNYEVSASGGNEAAKYFISGGYLDQQGQAIGVGYKRFSARANVEIKANDKLKFGLNIAPSYSIASDPGVDGKDQQMHIAASLTPIVEEGTGPENTNIGTYTNYKWAGTRPSPIAVLEKSIGDTKTFRTLSTVFAEYAIIKNLSAKTTINFDNEDSNTKRWSPAEVTGSRATTGQQAGFRRQNFANENTLTYSTNIDNHSISALGGMAYNTFKTDAFIWNGSGFASDEISTLNAATAISGNATEAKSVLISYFGRVQYSFNDRYLFTGSVRRDGSSKFGSNTKWGFFPSASVGWRISEENFMRDVSAISDFKLRASWGKAGNNTIGDYNSISLLRFSNTSFGGTLAKGLAPLNFPNPDLSWETSETIDVGLDVGILQNRITASFDYYTKDNTDLLLEIPVPTSSGFSRALTNIGEVTNKGWEVELHSNNLTRNFRWTTDVNFSHNTNEVRKLGPNNTPILFNGGFDIEHRIMKVGEPMNSLYLVQQIGVLSPEDIAAGYPMYNKEEAGDPKYRDVSGPDGVPDGKIDANDRVIMGSSNPKYVWGITNTFRFKGFDLNVLVQGQNGGYIYSMFGRAMDRTGQGFSDNTLGEYVDRWRSPEDPGNGKLHKMPSTFGRIKNTDWLYSSDYVRVRNITLGYNLGELLKTKFISGARIYCTAENWFGHDKYYGGYNPEAVNTDGDDYGAFPLSKSLIFGLNVTF